MIQTSPPANDNASAPNFRGLRTSIDAPTVSAPYRPLGEQGNGAAFVGTETTGNRLATLVTVASVTAENIASSVHANSDLPTDSFSEEPGEIQPRRQSSLPNIRAIYVTISAIK